MHYLTFYFALLVVSFTEASRCSNSFGFQEWQLNSSISFDLYSSLKMTSNDNIDEICEITLRIDFETGLVNGWFTPRNQSIESSENRLQVQSYFSLVNTSKTVHITYQCFTFDYCDVEFLCEIFSSAWAQLHMESFRQKLADHVYNSKNIGPVLCSGNTICSQQYSFCNARYYQRNDEDNIESGCGSPFGDEPVFYWLQVYTSVISDSITKYAMFYCNAPNCGSNDSVIETFQWLTREYVLPLNLSALQVAKPMF